MFGSHSAVQLASRDSGYHSTSVILRHHMDSVLPSLDHDSLHACQLSIGVLHHSYEAAMQIKLMRSLLRNAGRAQDACDILPPQQMQRPQQGVPVRSQRGVIICLRQGIAKTRDEGLQAGLQLACMGLCK